MKMIGAPSHKLSFEDAVNMWIMSWQGEIQSRIAAHFDVNGGRISEVLNEKTHVGSRNEALRRFKRSA